MCLYYFILFYMSKMSQSDFSFIKLIDKVIYVGGSDYLSQYTINHNGKLTLNHSKRYNTNKDAMNGSDIGFTPFFPEWPQNIKRLSSLAFDNCLNWKDEHPNSTVRDQAYDLQRLYYHTFGGDWKTMNYTCSNNFIKGVENYDSNHLWVCGTFGTFPRAFLVNKSNLEFVKFVDMNVMSCARYIDEPMATYRDWSTKKLYVASGWGLYRPDTNNPDVPNNNSTMMYSDWRLYRNLFTLPTSMAWVLSSDVNFINTVKETETHLYFFGHEINNQYGFNNQEDRHAWQSFLLRICKNDLGFKYVPTEHNDNLEQPTATSYLYGRIAEIDYRFALFHHEQGYNKSWYEDQVHLPTTHFATPLKVNFGCFIGKRPRSISDNQFWGDTNVVYMNRLVDVLFNPNRTIKFTTKSSSEFFGCSKSPHSQIPLIGLFNRPGIVSSGIEPAGALCQLQINENIFIEVGSKKSEYHPYNPMKSKNAYDELMSLSSTITTDFYSQTRHRTNGHTLRPYWNQGVLIGDRDVDNNNKIDFDNIGSCENENFYQKLNKEKFLKNMKVCNTAWPNQLTNRLTSINSAVCQYSTAELYGFNATFIVPGVEFKKIFLIKDNITDYVMHYITNERDSIARRIMSPLMVVAIISTRGDYYRVVLCDFDNGMANRGHDHSDMLWYNWCIFRHTDQPYLYRQYTPMENRTRGESVLFRASSLLIEKKIINPSDLKDFPINRDAQFHVVKDAIEKDGYIHVITTNNIHSLSLLVDCPSYRRCIDCASDPDCMWNIVNRECVKYMQKQYEASEYIQDVLDRGFQCGTLELNTTVIIFNNNAVMSFYCENNGFWRGKLEWWSNDKEITTFQSSELILSRDNTILTIINNTTFYQNLSCYGLLDDHDKLYREEEYDYIKSKKMEKKLLNRYQVLSKSYTSTSTGTTTGTSTSTGTTTATSTSTGTTTGTGTSTGTTTATSPSNGTTTGHSMDLTKNLWPIIIIILAIGLIICFLALIILFRCYSTLKKNKPQSVEGEKLCPLTAQSTTRPISSLLTDVTYLA